MKREKATAIQVFGAHHGIEVEIFEDKGFAVKFLDVLTGDFDYALKKMWDALEKARAAKVTEMLNEVTMGVRS
jgi:hypothetical protein